MMMERKTKHLIILAVAVVTMVVILAVFLDPFGLRTSDNIKIYTEVDFHSHVDANGYRVLSANSSSQMVVNSNLVFKPIVFGNMFSGSFDEMDHVRVNYTLENTTLGVNKSIEKVFDFTQPVGSPTISDFATFNVEEPGKYNLAVSVAFYSVANGGYIVLDTEEYTVIYPSV